MVTFEQLENLALDISSFEGENFKPGDWYLYSSPNQLGDKVWYEMIFEVYSPQEDDFSMRREGEINPIRGALMIAKAMKAFIKWKTSLPPGITISACPYKQDGWDNKRKQFYESLGFIDGYITT